MLRAAARLVADPVVVRAPGDTRRDLADPVRVASVGLVPEVDLEVLVARVGPAALEVAPVPVVDQVGSVVLLVDRSVVAVATRTTSSRST